jgi:hypothetical protein
MVVSALPLPEPASVSVLFAPDMVPIVDMFRTLGDFERHYDVLTLDRLEEELARIMSRDLAKAVVSDALLLAFGLRRERQEPIAFRPIGSRRGTLDEYNLLALIGAAYWHDFGLASDVAAALSLVHAQPLVSLASDIARRLEIAGLTIKAPDARLFRSAEASPVDVCAGAFDDEMKLNFDI